MHFFHSMGHTLGATLLVAATSIGVGMLALPLATGAGGFLPAIFIYLICWIFMLGSGLLILEACAWMPKDSNLITMATSLLGKPGKIACWILYLFLFSCLMVAHVASGSQMMGEVFKGLPQSYGGLIYIGIIGAIVFSGPLWVDRMNLVFFSGVLLTFFLFACLTIPNVQISNISRSDWSQAWFAMPVIFTAFGYQNLIPTLMTYLNRDLKKVRRAIIFGTSIPLVVYILWEFLILGVVPAEGPNGLIEALKLGQTAVTPLSAALKSPSIILVGKAFAAFAMTASFLGLAIAFVDFLADGFHVKKTSMNRFLFCLMIFGIPFIFTLINPMLFIHALIFAGGYGVALLLGAMPVMMVWAGRYYQGHSLLYQQFKGGKITLSLILLFILVELIFETYSNRL